MFCSNCANQLTDGDKFCDVCGSQIDAASGTPGQGSSPPGASGHRHQVTVH